MDRRRLLKTGLGMAAGALAGCAPRPDPNALLLRGWAYEPDLVRANLQRFTRALPQYPVDFATIAGAYHDKMVALFVAETALDVAYVRDDYLAEWVEAGWLRALDDFPGAAECQRDLFPFNREAITYDGKLFALPYYSDFTAWIWNRRMLEAAGFTECGRTLDEITEQCVKLREKRVSGPSGPVEYPLALAFKQAPLGFGDWWAMMYASEVRLFTPDFEPVFPDDPGRRSERIMQWLVDAFHKHRIMDLQTCFTTPIVRDLFAPGRLAMVSISKYDLQRLNDPTKSKTAGDAIMAPYPSIDPGLHGTLGWTRLYGMPAACRRPEAAWQLMQFLGGKDPSGEYSTPRFWYLERGLGFAFPSLLNDPEVVTSTKRWGDIDLIREQSRVARARENVKAPWFPEFDAFFQAEVQEVLQQRVTPRDGLARIAAECRRLRRKWAWGG